MYPTSQRTDDEYVLADRSASVAPVAFSLMASFMSAITLLGVTRFDSQIRNFLNKLETWRMTSFQGELLVRHAVRAHQPVLRAGHRLRRPLLPARLLQAAGEERLRIPGEALRPQGQVKNFVCCMNTYKS